MNTNDNKQLTVFLDAIGRTIIGTVAEETDSVLSVENPSLIHVQPNPASGQLQLQIIPLFFKEFLADRLAPTIWHYNKCNITQTAETEFAPQFIAQYNAMWTPPPSSNEEPKVVKLFDEEE